MNESSILEKESPIMTATANGRRYERRRSYFSENEEDASQTEDDAFLKKIYENTLYGTCQVPAVCHGSIEDQLDIFMNCRQPLSMFSFFQEHPTVDSACREMLPAGAYMLPTHCEYCKSPDTSLCPPHCTRPKLYFQKKRPPFQKLDPNRWNPQTDFALTAEEEEDLASTTSSSDFEASLASTSVSSMHSPITSSRFSTSKEYPTDVNSTSGETSHNTGYNASYESGASHTQSGQSWLGGLWSGSSDN